MNIRTYLTRCVSFNGKTIEQFDKAINSLDVNDTMLVTKKRWSTLKTYKLASHLARLKIKQGQTYCYIQFNGYYRISREV